MCLELIGFSRILLRDIPKPLRLFFDFLRGITMCKQGWVPSWRRIFSDEIISVGRKQYFEPRVLRN